MANMGVFSRASAAALTHALPAHCFKPCLGSSPPFTQHVPVPAPLHVPFLQLLHPQVTLQLCFLACALLRQPVTCYDIIGWALDAQLPFLRLPDIASRCLTGVQVLSRLLVFV